MAVPTASKAIPLENPDSCLPSQEQSLAEEAGTHASCDRPNGLADPLEEGQLKEADRDESTPVAGLSPPLKLIPAAENPITSSELQNLQEELAIGKGQNLSSVPDKNPTRQEVAQISIEALKSGEIQEVVPEEVEYSQLSVPEDFKTNSEPINTSDALDAVKGLADPHLEPVQGVPDDVTIKVITRSENLEKKEPVILLSKAIQSKGNSKTDSPHVSTRNMSGWFGFCEIWVHSFIFFILVC